MAKFISPAGCFSDLSRAFLLCLVLCCAASVRARADVPEQILHHFNAIGDGSLPYAGLVQSSDGDFYGVTSQGGPYNSGTVFQITPQGTLTTIHFFQNTDGNHPVATLILGQDGDLYGTTQFGGLSRHGVVFRVGTDGSGYTVLRSFGDPDGSEPSGLIQGSDGSLYGTTYGGGRYGLGTIYRISTGGADYSIIHDFSVSDGASPNGLMQGSDGLLYGTSSGHVLGGNPGQGVVFKTDTTGATFQVLHGFSAADEVLGGLVQGGDGTLYGSSYLGGSKRFGVLYRLGPDGTKYTVIHAFSGRDGANPGTLTQGSDGYLYGSTVRGGASDDGVVFKASADGTTYQILRQCAENRSAQPAGRLIQGSDGRLYGVTATGETLRTSLGSVFSIDRAGHSFSTLFYFSDGVSDGIDPGYGSLTMSPDGYFYGTTRFGGSSGLGTLYRIDPTTGQTASLHPFSYDGVSGYEPQEGVIFGSNGVLYGVTSAGGLYGSGTIYSYSPATGVLRTLYSFPGAGISRSPSTLVQMGEFLYGVTLTSADGSFGSVYRLSLREPEAPSGFSVIYSFPGGASGAFPRGRLLAGADGKLYGTTEESGARHGGTVFCITPAGVLTTIHSFGGPDGAHPQADLTQGSDGLLYGTTRTGGDNGFGGVFRVEKDGSGFQLLHSFSATDGYTYAGVIQGSDGLLYGTTYSGGAGGHGSVYSCAADASSFTILHLFTNAPDGANPLAGVVEGPDGNLYGTTNQGGGQPAFLTTGGGVVYMLQTQLPIINGFSPTRGSAGTTVTLMGSNLAGATAVTINGIAQTIVSGSTALQFTVAPGTTSGPIVVTLPTGATTSARPFIITP